MEEMPSPELVARWRQGDQQAAAELFRRYTERLVGLARSRLSNKLRRRVDPEDVVQSVYRSFFADASGGRYDVQRGGDLWRLLVVITLEKVRSQVEKHTAGKRAVNKEQAFGSEESLLQIQALRKSFEPEPGEAVALAEELERLMARLEPLDRQMLELRLQGYNLQEIAAATRRSERTVTRVLREVKDYLEQQRSVGLPR